MFVGSKPALDEDFFACEGTEKTREIPFGVVFGAMQPFHCVCLAGEPHSIFNRNKRIPRFSVC